MSKDESCGTHNLDLACLTCMQTVQEKYIKLVEFLRKIISGEVGYLTPIVLDAENLLKEIGEL